MNIATKKLTSLNIAILFFAFIDSIYIYIASTYFSEVIGSDNVGLFYLVAYAGSLLFYFFADRMIHTLGSVRVLYLFLLATLFFASVLANSNPSLWSLGILVGFIITSSIVWVLWDVLLEFFSRDSETGQIRGLILTLTNLGVLFAPLLAARIFSQSGFQGIFFVETVLYMVLFLYVLLVFRHDNVRPQKKLRFWQSLNELVANKPLSYSYLLSLTVFFFYSVMIIYMPLKLLALGFVWDEIGFMFSLMLIPFLFVPVPVGYLADKWYGEKEMLIVSLLWTAGFSWIIAWLDSDSFWVWTAVLFVSRVGVSVLETLKDSYFFKQVDQEDVDMIALFRTALPVANILTAALAAALFGIFALNSIFWVTGGLCLLTCVGIWHLKDTR